MIVLLNNFWVAGPVFSEPFLSVFVDFLASGLCDVLSCNVHVEMIVDSLSALQLGHNFISGVEVSSINFWISSPVIGLMTIGEDFGGVNFLNDGWLSVRKVA